MQLWRNHEWVLNSLGFRAGAGIARVDVPGEKSRNDSRDRLELEGLPE
jgi:hypothetical protein